MGGHNAGDVASNLVVNAIRSYLTEMDPSSVTPELVKDALCQANTLVWSESRVNINRKGMGSTATVAVFTNGKVYIGQVGDSRAYLYRSAALSQITTDHSYVQILMDKGLISQEEAACHPQKNIITRAVGTEKDVEADTFTVKLQQGDVILLCSDGLSNAVSDDEMAAILSNDLQTATDRLIQAALDNGGTDNVSAVIAAMSGGAQ
jgi:protein phosphatase